MEYGGVKPACDQGHLLVSNPWGLLSMAWSWIEITQYCIEKIMEFHTFLHFSQKLALQAQNCCDDASKLFSGTITFYLETDASKQAYLDNSYG